MNILLNYESQKGWDGVKIWGRTINLSHTNGDLKSQAAHLLIPGQLSRFQSLIGDEGKGLICWFYYQDNDGSVG